MEESMKYERNIAKIANFEIDTDKKIEKQEKQVRNKSGWSVLCVI